MGQSRGWRRGCRCNGERSGNDGALRERRSGRERCQVPQYGVQDRKKKTGQTGAKKGLATMLLSRREERGDGGGGPRIEVEGENRTNALHSTE